MMDSKSKLYRERALDLVRRVGMRFMAASARAELEVRVRRDAFRAIAREGRWGGAYRSGWGSTVAGTETTREIIETVVKRQSVRSMLDAACGDFSWMPLVLQRLPEDFRYVGCDVVPELISKNSLAHPQHEFRVTDIVVDDLPQCDLILCRDVLQHLPVSDIKRALDNFSRSGAKFLLASTHLRRSGWRNRRNMRVGQCRDRNLLLQPFNLADPIAIYSEQDGTHKFLALWKLPLTYLDRR